MTDFTTWSAFRTAVLNAMASYVSDGSMITKSYSTPDGRTHNIRSFDELKKLLEYANKMADLESAGSDGPVRNYARFKNPV
jgi:hypothetical protein